MLTIFNFCCTIRNDDWLGTDDTVKCRNDAQVLPFLSTNNKCDFHARICVVFQFARIKKVRSGTMDAHAGTVHNASN